MNQRIVINREEPSEEEVLGKIYTALFREHDLLGAKKGSEYTRFKPNSLELMNEVLQPGA